MSYYLLNRHLGLKTKKINVKKISLFLYSFEVPLCHQKYHNQKLTKT